MTKNLDTQKIKKGFELFKLHININVYKIILFIILQDLNFYFRIYPHYHQMCSFNEFLNL